MGGLGGLGGLSAEGGIMVPQLSVQLDGALVWLAADKITGLVNADPVTTWTNAGTGANFTQATAANKPTYRTAVQNGLAVVRFDGTNDLLTSASTMSLTQPCTIYWVASRTGNTDAYNVGMTQTTETIAFGFNNTANNWYLYSNPALVVQAASDSAFHVMVSDFNAASSVMYMDSLTGAAKTLDTGDVSGDSFHVGATSAAGAPLAGDIGEILVFPGSHSTAQRTLVTNYLATKWGVTLS